MEGAPSLASSGDDSVSLNLAEKEGRRRVGSPFYEGRSVVSSGVVSPPVGKFAIVVGSCPTPAERSCPTASDRASG